MTGEDVAGGAVTAGVTRAVVTGEDLVSGTTVVIKVKHCLNIKVGLVLIPKGVMASYRGQTSLNLRLGYFTTYYQGELDHCIVELFS